MHQTFIVLKMLRGTSLDVSLAVSFIGTDCDVDYVLLDGVELMFVGIGFITLPIAVFAYTRINAKRDAYEKEMEGKGIRYSAKELRELGDRAPDFRYTL